MFDIKSFCSDYNIRYYTEGKNVQTGWVNIKCPFCSDHSNHLGFNLRKGFFYCWRCNWKSKEDVLKKLAPEDNPGFILKQYNIRYREGRSRTCKIKNSKPVVVPGGPLLDYHREYIVSRGLDPDVLEEKYKIKGTNYLGDYKFRVIAPIIERGRIVSYQGRDVTGVSDLRYKACKKEDELVDHKSIIYNIDNCKEDFLIVTEGIFDVWNIGDNSCCTFGKSYTINQLVCISRFKIVFVYYDPDYAGKNASRKLCKDLIGLGVETYSVENKKEPADLNFIEKNNFLREISKFVYS